MMRHAENRPLKRPHMLPSGIPRRQDLDTLVSLFLGAESRSGWRCPPPAASATLASRLRLYRTQACGFLAPTKKQWLSPSSATPASAARFAPETGAVKIYQILSRRRTNQPSCPAALRGSVTASRVAVLFEGRDAGVSEVHTAKSPCGLVLKRFSSVSALAPPELGSFEGSGSACDAGEKQIDSAHAPTPAVQ